MRFLSGMMAVALALALIQSAQECFAQTEGGPPEFTAEGYNEDYSYLKNPAARTNFFDPVKFVALDQSENSYLTFGGQFRDRYEYFNNYTFGSGPQDPNGYNLIRVLFDADLHLGSYFRVFVQGISATEQGRVGGPRTSDVDDVNLHQAFLEAGIPFSSDVKLTLRVGRQVIVFGAQRLIGVSDFTNIRRINDAVRGTLVTPGNTFDFFYSRPVRQWPYSFDDEYHDTYFAGVYDTVEMPGVLADAKMKMDLYALYDNRDSITFNTLTSGEDRTTLGLRTFGQPGHFDFDVEGDYQIGRFADEATHSFSIASIGGYKLEDVTFSPTASLGFDLASGGDKNHPGDAFDQLFPSGHDQFGIIDAIGRQNIIDVHPRATWTLVKDQRGAKLITLLTQYRQFWRESDQDAVYTSAGVILRPSGASDSSSVGGEFDLQLNWQINRYLEAYGGYCHFFHGQFIADTGPAQDIDFAFSALTFTF